MSEREVGEGALGARWRRIWSLPSVRWGAAAWLTMRIISTASAAYTQCCKQIGDRVEVPGYTPPALEGPMQSLFGVWMQQDALWYLRIAKHWYGEGPETFAFFPAYPALVAAFRPLFGGHELYAAMFVANLAALAGLIALFAFAEHLTDRRGAAATVFAFALFPTAFFLGAPYAEPVLLAAGAGALVLSLRGRYEAAAVAACVAALSRPFGWVLFIPLLAIAWSSKERSPLRWLPPVASVVSVAAWAAYAAMVRGDVLALMRVQSIWQREAQPFWLTIPRAFSAAVQTRDADFGIYFLFDVACLIFAAAVVAGATFLLLRRGQRWMAAGIGTYGCAVIVMPLSSVFLPRPLLSFPRFVLALFPCFIAAAWLPWWVRYPAAVGSGVLLYLATGAFVAVKPLF